jgi:hypothetical protein
VLEDLPLSFATCFPVASSWHTTYPTFSLSYSHGMREQNYKVKFNVLCSVKPCYKLPLAPIFHDQSNHTCTSTDKKCNPPDTMSRCSHDPNPKGLVCLLELPLE